jgi:hypothetical protein
MTRQTDRDRVRNDHLSRPLPLLQGDITRLEYAPIQHEAGSKNTSTSKQKWPQNGNRANFGFGTLARWQGGIVGRHLVWLKFLFTFAVLIFLLTKPTLAGHVLITDEEAKRPPPKEQAALNRRGITRAPRAEFVSESAPIHSPFHFQIRFQSFGGTTIEASSVKITYLKDPLVDLTPRIKDFITPTGIDVPDVEIPVGEHAIRVELKDSDGRSGAATFNLKIAPEGQ